MRHVEELFSMNVADWVDYQWGSGTERHGLIALTHTTDLSESGNSGA